MAAEKIDDATAVNLGTMERIWVIDAALIILDYFRHEADIQLLPDKPVGPPNRVADHSLAAEILGWRPSVLFRNGLIQTMEWSKRELIDRA